jgi:RND family efflux transporter MFP subunit
MRTVLTYLFQLVLSLAILLTGGMIFRHLKKTAPKIQRARSEETLQQVKILRAHAEDLPITIEAHGVLRAAQEVILRAEVTGPVKWLSKRLVPGQRVTKGEELLRIDDRDYRFALSRVQATLEQARQNLELEAGRHRIAKKEWNLFQKEQAPPLALSGKPPSKSLALRLPQLATARASVASAQSAYEEAHLNLERTHIRAPFNALVQAKRVEVGQHITSQSELVHLVGVDTAWIELPLTPRQLAQIRIPGVHPGPGSQGNVSTQLAGQRVERPARVLHLLPRVDEGVRFARVLVEVKHPFYQEDPKESFPLLLGSYCKVSLKGIPFTRVLPLPRAALRERSQVYLLDSQSRLRSRRVHVIWEQAQRVWIDQGLAPEERVVVGHIPSPVEGSLCRPEGEEQP